MRTPHGDKTTESRLGVAYSEAGSAVRVEGRNWPELQRNFSGMMEMLPTLVLLLPTWIHLTKLIKCYILKMGTFYLINSISINLIYFKSVLFPGDSINIVKSLAFGARIIGVQILV